MLAYLNVFRDWIKERLTASRETVKRRRTDYPHYAKDRIYVFPFEHTELWADTPPEILAAYAELVDKVVAQIGRSNLPFVRNGLEHKRDENRFPDPGTMIECANRLQDVVDTVDDRRLIPKLYWKTESSHDVDGNVRDTFTDYRGAVLSLWEPSPVLAGRRKEFAKPYLIAPFDFLNEPNSMLVFLVSPRTEYRDYWKDYPRRRVIPAGVESCNEADTGAADEQRM